MTAFRAALTAACLLAAYVAVAAPRVEPAAAPVAPTTAIKVDQAGYPPSKPKLAMVVAEEGSVFAVRRAGAPEDGEPAFAGTLGPPVDDPDSGDRVRVADFSALTAPGDYVLEVPGVGRSWPFSVAHDVYARPLYLAARAFYGQRCGTAVDLGADFPGYAHPPCHRRVDWHPSSGRSSSPGGGPRPPTGGWHDAGDYGRYVVNSGITTGTLLWAWELYRPTFENLSLDLPESGDGVPDLLDEVRFNLEWMLAMQDGDGGAWHKQTPRRFSGFVMPQDDASVHVVVGTGRAPFKGSCATAHLAAVAAIAGRVYEPYDRDFARRALAAARRAWAWLAEHPDVTFQNPDDVGTGEYGDRDCGDERLWAAVELWRTTGEAGFRDHFLRHAGEYREALSEPPSWPRVAPPAFWGYALSAGGDDGEAAGIRRDVLAAADAVVARSARHGYRISLKETDYVWGSNAVAANYGVALLVAHALSPDRRYLEAALDNLHYLLGRNTFSLSWVTRVGAKSFRHPHHRPSAADGLPEPWPGLLAGGPNRRRQDPAARRLPDLPPARMYLDDVESYGTNEIAVNWNAPLVFLLAGVQIGSD